MKTRDLHVESNRPLVPPTILLEELPLTEPGSQVIARTRDEIIRILKGDDDRLIAVVGPCSVHDPAAALDYARRLQEQAVANIHWWVALDADMLETVFPKAVNEPSLRRVQRWRTC